MDIYNIVDDLFKTYEDLYATPRLMKQVKWKIIVVICTILFIACFLVSVVNFATVSAVQETPIQSTRSYDDIPEEVMTQKDKDRVQAIKNAGPREREYGFLF